jgi:hypothetical protein
MHIHQTEEVNCPWWREMYFAGLALSVADDSSFGS